MKRKLWLLIVLLLCAVLTACGSTDEVKLQRIEVDTTTLNTTITQGDTVNVEDAVLVLHYSNGESARVPLADATMQGRWDTAEAGPHTVVFVYEGVRYTFAYTVKETSHVTLTGTLTGVKTTYERGEEPLLEGTFVLNGTTYRLQDYAQSVRVQGWDTQTAGDKTCTLTLTTAAGEVTLTFAYTVAPEVKIDRVVYTGDVLELDVGDGDAAILRAVNQHDFVIYYDDENTEHVAAEAIADFVTTDELDAGTGHAIVRNLAGQTATVDLPYRVVRRYAAVNVTFAPGEGFPTIALPTQNGKITAPLVSNPGYTPTWLTEDNDVFDFDAVITKPITLHAVWQKVTYVISFVDGGNLANTTIEYTIDSTVTLVPPEKKGCAFLRFEDEEGTIMPLTLEAGKYARDMILTVVWDPAQFNINYVLQGSANYPVSNDNPATYTAYQSLTLANAVRKGYTFTGWALGAADGPIVTTVGDGAEDLTLYATWKADTFHVYLVNGSLESNDAAYIIETMTVSPSETRTLLEAPTLADYRWEGWYANPECTQSLLSGSKYYLRAGIKEDTYVYAKTTRVYTLHLARNVEGEQDVDLVFAIGDDDQDSPYRSTYLANWQTASYRFGCDAATWQGNGYTVTLSEGIPSMTTTDLARHTQDTLSAQWVGHSHTILYYYNCVINGQSSLLATYNTLEDVVLPSPFRPGYTFDGWTWENDAMKRRVPSISAGTYDEDLTLYAQWKE